MYSAMPLYQNLAGAEFETNFHSERAVTLRDGTLVTECSALFLNLLSQELTTTTSKTNLPNFCHASESQHTASSFSVKTVQMSQHSHVGQTK